MNDDEIGTATQPWEKAAYPGSSGQFALTYDTTADQRLAAAEYLWTNPWAETFDAIRHLQSRGLWQTSEFVSDQAYDDIDRVVRRVERVRSEQVR